MNITARPIEPRVGHRARIRCHAVSELAGAPIIEIDFLGPLVVRHEGEVVRIGPPKERSLLALLALGVGRTVPVAQLIDGLWDDDPPQSAGKTLQTYVSGLRRALPAGVLETKPVGYALLVPDEAIDATRFENGLKVAAANRDSGQTAEAQAAYADALSEWRGRALMDAGTQMVIETAAARLEELRRDAVEELNELRLADGRARDLTADLEEAVQAEPLRERRWAQLMVALYRSDRQADTLRAYRRLSTILAEELGIEPSRAVSDLEQAILIRDPSLDSPATGSQVALSGAPVAAPEPLRTLGVDDVLTVRASLRLEDGRLLDIPAHGLRIGRAPDNDLVLDDPRASRHHASIVRIERTLVLTDRQSTNGTLVGANRVETGVRLSDGDVITVGSTRLTYVEGSDREG